MNSNPHLPSRPPFTWRWNWKLALFVAVFFPVTVGLGFWQLERADQKKLLLKEFTARRAAPLVAIGELKAPGPYSNVRVQGQFDNDHHLLLDNRVRGGQAGYELLSPFRTLPTEREPARWLLVNRGWIAGNPDRRVLPEIPAVTPVVELEGYLYRSPGEAFLLKEEVWAEKDWPLVVQSVDLAKIGQHMQRAFYPFQLRLGKFQPGALQTGWQVVNVKPGKHIAYAVQWFAMAITLAVLALFGNSNLAVWLKGRRQPAKPRVSCRHD